MSHDEWTYWKQNITYTSHKKKKKCILLARSNTEKTFRKSFIHNVFFFKQIKSAFYVNVFVIQIWRFDWFVSLGVLSVWVSVSFILTVRPNSYMMLSKVPRSSLWCKRVFFFYRILCSLNAEFLNCAFLKMRRQRYKPRLYVKAFYEKNEYIHTPK